MASLLPGSQPEIHAAIHLGELSEDEPGLCVRMARAEFADIEKGEDVAAAKKQARLADSFDELAHRYLEDHAKKLKRTWEEDERVINRDLLPAWRNRKAADISRRDVKVLIQGIADRGAGVMANRTLALISKIFNFAVEEEVVSANPAYRIPKAMKEQSRSRVLNGMKSRPSGWLWTGNACALLPSSGYCC
jgi:hypothetical protein